MALAVAQAIKIKSSSSYSVTVNSAWTVSAGSLIVAVVTHWEGSTGADSCSDSIEGNYTEIAGPLVTGGSSGAGISMWYHANVGSGTPNLTVAADSSASVVTGIFHEVTGAATAPFVAGEVASNGLTATTNPQTASVTNSVADSVFFAALTNDDPTSPTSWSVNQTGSSPTGWALKDATNSIESISASYQNASVPYLIVSSSAATKHGWSQNSAASAYVIACFKIAAGGASVSVAGTLATSGTLSKVNQKLLAGTLATAGVLVKAHAKAYAGTLATSGVLVSVKTTLVSVAGTLATSGTLVQSFARGFAGTLVSAGVLVKVPARVLAGTLAMSGTNALAHAKAYAGTLATSGVLVSVKTKVVNVAGTLVTAGVLGPQAISRFFAGTLVTAGGIRQAFSRAFAGTLDTSATLNVSTGGALTLAAVQHTSHIDLSW